MITEDMQITITIDKERINKVVESRDGLNDLLQDIRREFDITFINVIDTIQKIRNENTSIACGKSCEQENNSTIDPKVIIKGEILRLKEIENILYQAFKEQKQFPNISISEEIRNNSSAIVTLIDELNRL